MLGQHHPVLPAITIGTPNLVLSDLAHSSEKLLSNGLIDPGPMTIALVFLGGLLTSLGPCSLSLLPVTIAYLAGFKEQQNPFLRSLAFSSGIVTALVLLGSISGIIGRIYGQVPSAIPSLVALLAIFMGLNLMGLFTLPMPKGPNPDSFKEKVPSALSPIAAGLAFGLAASPCTTPVLAILLGWIAQSGSPIIGAVLLSFFGIGQVFPLILAGTAAAIIPNLLALRPISRWIPPVSGMIFVTTGLLTLIARWI